MVNYILMISSDLENLTNLQPQAGCNDPNFSYFFKLKCGCGELSPKETCVSLGETLPLTQGGKGTTNLVQKLAGSQYENVDLSGGDFTEYDEKGECPVTISNLHFKLEAAKN